MPSSAPTSPWHLAQWRDKTACQLPHYQDTNQVAQVEQQIAKYPPLVFAGEIRQLQQELSQAEQGKSFVLQGGDCAERFADFNATTIRDQFRILLQMAAVMTYASACPIIKIGRLAGQFAKPRSADTETQNGVTLPSYRGDIVNGLPFDKAARQPDPARMERAYWQSAATLNLLRALAQGGYADLHQVQQWNQDFTATTPYGARYQQLANRVGDCLRFMQACGLQDPHQLQATRFYTSHEALLLGYEQALTRQDSLTGQWYATSAHFLWIGDRTRDVEGAHVAFLQGVCNPIGIKLGPTIDKNALLALIQRLNPDNQRGRLVLISRMGHQKIADHLPPLLRAVKAHGLNATWLCDPMHGNTQTTHHGIKTRDFSHVLSEVEQFFSLHHSEGTCPGGIHLELTGQNVTECLGGGQSITPEQLHQAYHSACDPRLNGNQSLELAFAMADWLNQSHRAGKSTGVNHQRGNFLV